MLDKNSTNFPEGGDTHFLLTGGDSIPDPLSFKVTIERSGLNIVSFTVAGLYKYPWPVTDGSMLIYMLVGGQGKWVQHFLYL